MLILASSAKHRQELLEQVNISVDKLIPADIDETILKKETPNAYVQRLAIAKAEAVHKNNKDAFVIGADTIVCAGKKIILKTMTDNDERKALDLISGRKVNVITGYCVIAPDGRKSVRYVKTSTTMKRMTAQEKEEYVKTKEWVGISGGMCIEGVGAKFIKGINGSYANIVGLCPYSVNNMLVGLGYKK